MHKLQQALIISISMSCGALIVLSKIKWQMDVFMNAFWVTFLQNLLLVFQHEMYITAVYRIQLVQANVVNKPMKYILAGIPTLRRFSLTCMIYILVRCGTLRRW